MPTPPTTAGSVYYLYDLAGNVVTELIAPEVGIASTLNLYAIVRDNPETFADLDGHCPPGQNCDADTTGRQRPFSKTGEPHAQKPGDGQPLPQQVQQHSVSPDTNKKQSSGSLGNHVFVTVAGGLGLGVDLKLGVLKGTAEASIKSEGKYTLSGKSTVSAAKHAKLTIGAGPLSGGVGYVNETTTRYNGISASAPRVGPIEKETHGGLLFSGAHGTGATISGGSLEIRPHPRAALGGCLEQSLT